MLPRLFRAASLALLVPAALAQPVLYVDADAAGANTGANWADAFPDLQQALAAARADASVEDIWVAEGTYRPTASGSRSVSFELVNGVGIYGGFAGTETDRNEADPAFRPTVLTGNVGDPASSFDNTYQVVHAVSLSDTTRLDGLTIRDGRANRSYAPPTTSGLARGGGIYAENAVLVLSRVALTGNVATTSGSSPDVDRIEGGGLYAIGSAIRIVDSSIEDNAATGPIYGIGGAIFQRGGSLSLENVRVAGNQAGGFRGDGGAIYAFAATVDVVGSAFLRNSAGSVEGRGGAIYCSAAACRVQGSTFVRNTVDSFGSGGALSGVGRVEGSAFFANGAGGGGAIAMSNGSIANSIFASNSAFGAGSPFLDGAALLAGSGTVRLDNVSSWQNTGAGGTAFFVSGTLEATNSAFDEPAGQFLATSSSGSALIQRSLVSPGYAGGTDVIDGDPRFLRTPSSGPDEVWGTEDDDYGDFHLLAGSPALDAGDAALLPADVFDLDGDGDTTEPLPLDFAREARVQNGALDLGALEGAAATPLGPVIYVDADATAGGTGASWETAFSDLQDALALARDTSIVEEIWVAEGTYTPTDDGDRSVSFELVSGVGLYGGFDGTEMERGEADPIAHRVVLSGDIGVADETDDNSYHVARAIGLQDTVRLAGLRITGGRANHLQNVPGDDYPVAGAGLLIQSSPLVLSRVTVADNRANLNFDSDLSGSARGGGIYAQNASLRLDSVRVVRNGAGGEDGGRGGGIYAQSSSISIHRSIVESNGAGGPSNSTGGGIHIGGSGAVLDIRDSTIRDNSVGFGSLSIRGGGLYCAASCRIRDSSFLSNSAGQYCIGGGIYNVGTLRVNGSRFVGNTGYGAGAIGSSGTTLMTNTSFWGNTAVNVPDFDEWNGPVVLVEGGTVSLDGVSSLLNRTAGPSTPPGHGHTIYVVEGSVRITNSIFREDGGSLVLTLEEGDANVQRSLVAGGFAGGTDILDADPLFTLDPSLGPDEQWGTEDDDYGDLRLQWTSPAVDAGDASLLPADVLDLDGDGDTAEPIPFDADGNARVEGTALDLGAYESPFNVAAEDEPALPMTLALTAAPNPFTHAATVTLALPAQGEARVEAYDVLGREVAVLHDGPLAAGRHPLALGDGLAPGLYLVRAETGEQAITLRVTKSR
jgi:hypothetical protein